MVLLLPEKTNGFQRKDVVVCRSKAALLRCFYEILWTVIVVVGENRWYGCQWVAARPKIPIEQHSIFPKCMRPVIFS